MSPSQKKNSGKSRRRSSIKDGEKDRDRRNGASDTFVVQEKRPMKKSMKLTVKPNWEEIEEVRNSSGEFFRSHGFSGDAVNALTMVISELIENGIKYNSYWFACCHSGSG